jgi:hypothetical protein
LAELLVKLKEDEAGLSVSKLVRLLEAYVSISKLETRTSMLDEFQASMTSIDTRIDNLKRKIIGE